MEILKTGNPVLIQKSKKINKINTKLLDTIKEMEQTLRETHDPVGVGLAAPQVGIPLRLFLAKPSEKSEILTFINPEIVGAENKTDNNKENKTMQKKSKTLLEGCLSLPNIWGNVSRKKELTLKYKGINGKYHKRKFKGFLATIIQHEIDHLNGILFTKKVMEQSQKLYRSYKNEKGEDEFEEINV